MLKGGIITPCSSFGQHLWNSYLPLKELAAVDETLDCCVELMTSFIDVSLLICVSSRDEAVDTSTTDPTSGISV